MYNFFVTDGRYSTLPPHHLLQPRTVAPSIMSAYSAEHLHRLRHAPAPLPYSTVGRQGQPTAAVVTTEQPSRPTRGGVTTIPRSRHASTMSCASVGVSSPTYNLPRASKTPQTSTNASPGVQSSNPTSGPSLHITMNQVASSPSVRNASLLIPPQSPVCLPLSTSLISRRARSAPPIMPAETPEGCVSLDWDDLDGSDCKTRSVHDASFCVHMDEIDA